MCWCKAMTSSAWGASASRMSSFRSVRLAGDFSCAVSRRLEIRGFPGARPLPWCVRKVSAVTCADGTEISAKGRARRSEATRQSTCSHISPARYATSDTWRPHADIRSTAHGVAADAGNSSRSGPSALTPDDVGRGPLDVVPGDVMVAHALTAVDRTGVDGATGSAVPHAGAARSGAPGGRVPSRAPASASSPSGASSCSGPDGWGT